VEVEQEFLHFLTETFFIAIVAEIRKIILPSAITTCHFFATLITDTNFFEKSMEM